MLKALKTVVRNTPGMERLARMLLDRRYQLARAHLRGVGLEIGALDRPLMLPRRARAYYIDRLLPSQLRAHYPELDGRRFYVSLVANGEDLACIADGSLDFLVANHVIEHTEDPLGTLMTFAQKLRVGGVLFMAVPDMRRTFDHARPETPWQHLLDDHTRGAEQSRRAHFDEWATIVEGRTDSDAATRAAELLAQSYSIHFHCWTLAGFTDFLHHVRDYAPLSLTATRSWRNENIFILTKR